MTLEQIPIWGQFGILGFFISVAMFFLVQYIRGELVSRKQLDDAHLDRDSWRQAWEVSQQTNRDSVALLAQLTVTSQTMERVLNALPPAQETRPDGTRVDGGA